VYEVFHFQYLIYLDLLGSEPMNSSGFNPISQVAGENRPDGFERGCCKRHSEKPFGLELCMRAITLIAGRLRQTHFLKLAGKAVEATSGQQQCKFRNRRSVAEQEDSHRDAGKRHGGRV
jgi:hypothetical protein